VNGMLNIPPVEAPEHPDVKADRRKREGFRSLRVSWNLVSFFSVVLLLCVLLNRAVVVEIPGFGKRPLEVNGMLLCLAFCASIVSWGTTVFVALRHGKVAVQLRAWILGALSAVAVFAPVCLVIAALRPAPLPPDQDYVFLPPQRPVEHELGVTFLYPNGRDFLLPSEVPRLANELEMLRRCDGAKMELRGFASSAPYKTDNEARNLLLANKRADSLSRQLRERGLDIVPYHWPTFFAMATGRRIRDVDASGVAIRAKERLNRRVEVWWTEETACMGEATK
jgi:outer membrane protein OmpA-like peptidoglycan-associated protein